MKNKNHILAIGWIEKADKDLEVAELLVKKKKQYLDLASFHCQQAFEKYLKGLLVFNGVLPSKTHNLEELLSQAFKYHLGLLKWVNAAKEISPFAVIPRYPDELFDIPIPTVKKLIKQTKSLAEFIKELIILY